MLKVHYFPELVLVLKANMKWRCLEDFMNLS